MIKRRKKFLIANQHNDEIKENKENKENNGVEYRVCSPVSASSSQSSSQWKIQGKSLPIPL